MTRRTFAVINVLQFSDSNANFLFHAIAASRCLSPQGHVGVQRPKERSEGRKKEPPVFSFPLTLEVLGEIGGGVFDLRVPLRASVRWECSATAVLHVSSD